MILQECLPVLPGCPWCLLRHVELNGGFGDIKAQFQELSVNPWRAPEWVITLKLSRCQRMRVSGLTIYVASREDSKGPMRRPRKNLSVGLIFSFGEDRAAISSCFRRNRFSRRT